MFQLSRADNQLLQEIADDLNAADIEDINTIIAEKLYDMGVTSGVDEMTSRKQVEDFAERLTEKAFETSPEPAAPVMPAAPADPANPTKAERDAQSAYEKSLSQYQKEKTSYDNDRQAYLENVTDYIDVREINEAIQDARDIDGDLNVKEPLIARDSDIKHVALAGRRGEKVSEAKVKAMLEAALEKTLDLRSQDLANLRSFQEQYNDAAEGYRGKLRSSRVVYSIGLATELAVAVSGYLGLSAGITESAIDVVGNDPMALLIAGLSGAGIWMLSNMYKYLRPSVEKNKDGEMEKKSNDFARFALIAASATIGVALYGWSGMALIPPIAMMVTGMAMTRAGLQKSMLSGVFESSNDNSLYEFDKNRAINEGEQPLLTLQDMKRIPTDVSGEELSADDMITRITGVSLTGSVDDAVSDITSAYAAAASKASKTQGGNSDKLENSVLAFQETVAKVRDDVVARAKARMPEKEETDYAIIEHKDRKGNVKEKERVMADNVTVERLLSRDRVSPAALEMALTL